MSAKDDCAAIGTNLLQVHLSNQYMSSQRAGRQAGAGRSPGQIPAKTLPAGGQTDPESGTSTLEASLACG